MYRAVGHCAKVKKLTPAKVRSHIYGHRCFMSPMESLNAELARHPDETIEDVLFIYGTRHWWGRLCFRAKWYQRWYTTAHRRHRRSTLINYLRHRRIVRLAKRRRKLRKRTPFMRVVYRTAAFSFAFVVLLFLVTLYESMDEEAKQQAYAFIRKGFTMFLKDILDM